LLQWNDVLPSLNKALLPDVAAYPQVTETTTGDSTTGEDPLIKAQKHPYNFPMRGQPSSGYVFNWSTRKKVLSHNQVICLVGHALSDLSIRSTGVTSGWALWLEYSTTREANKTNSS